MAKPSLEDRIPFACPDCGSMLEQVAFREAYLCGSCKKEWGRIGGIPCFSEHSFYWRHSPPESLREVLARAQVTGWRTALASFVEKSNEKELEEYVFDGDRADWFPFTAFDSLPKVLDLGSGYGAVTEALSEWSDLVVATDVNYEMARLNQLRSIETGHRNILPVVTRPLAIGRLPFADAFFDLAIMNGVLEWVGYGDLTKTVKDLQVKALEETRRVLKASGLLYIGIENRFSLTVLAGRPTHLAVPYLDALPRKLATWVAHRNGIPEGFRVHTYTILGYRRMLEKAGFKIKKILHVFPSYREPSYVFPMTERNIVRFVESNYLRGFKRLLFRLAELARADQILTHGLGLVAEAV